MTAEQGFQIELASTYSDWWRYNVVLMCSCFDAQNNRTGFASKEDSIAGVGANLAKKPAGTPSDRRICLSTPHCEHIVLYIYIIPHTLPAANVIDYAGPFEIDLHINYAGHTVLVEKRAINQWSGASIELHVAAK